MHAVDIINFESLPMTLTEDVLERAFQQRAETKRPDPHLILCGVIIFAIGLFKKIGISDFLSLAIGNVTSRAIRTASSPSWVCARDAFSLARV